MLAAGSTALAVLALASMWLLARKHPAGWLIAIAAQALWVPYDVATSQFGFLLITLVSVPVYVRGWRSFQADRRTRLAAESQGRAGSPVTAGPRQHHPSSGHVPGHGEAIKSD